MDFNSALDIIIKDLGEATRIIDDLKNYSGVPALQVELAKAKCRSAAEIIAMLKEKEVAPEVVKPSEARKTHVAPAIVKPSESAEIPFAPDAVADRQAGKEVSEESEAKNLSSTVESVKILKGNLPETLDLIDDAGNEPAPVEKALVPPKMETGKPVSENPDSAKSKGGGAAIFADRFKDVPGRVSEKMQALRPEEDLTSRLKQSPISNLADAIGVNDRFYFIREVFGGNNNAYREAIERLNTVSKVNEAVEIIKGYTAGEANQEAVSDLLALVKRKTGFDE
jgi:hypothetical protein